MANPMLLAIGLIIATFILEDAATTAGAFLASQAIMPVELAFGAVISGIIIGDAAIYGLGFSAQSHQRVKKFLDKRNLLPDTDIVDRHMAIAVITARFLPGFRFPTYVLAGFLRMSFPLFMGIIVIAVGIWTTILFWVVYQIGEAVTHIPPYLVFGLYIGVVVAVYFLMPRIIKRMKKKKQPTDDA
ncbi:MAG: DedA family protein [Bdellovibrionales bacterium]